MQPDPTDVRVEPPDPSATQSTLLTLFRKHENLIKYGLIGASAVVIDLGLFVLLHEVFDVAPWISHSVSVGVSVVWSFLLNAFFNFGTTDRLLARFVSFASVAFVGYLVGLAIIFFLTESFDTAGTIAKVISMPPVFLTQYVLNTRYSFRTDS